MMPLVVVFAGVAFGAFAGCDARSPPPVVAYISVDEQIARPVLAAFTARTGLPVEPLFDTEATKTTALASRLRRETSRPRADLFWSSAPFEVERLAREEILVPAIHPELDAHPARWRRSDGRWFAFAGRARVIVYDPEVIDPADAPVRWTSLVEPRFKDRVVMADPRFGTTRGHLGAMSVFWNRTAMPGYFEAWLDGLAENGVRMLPGGNAATVDAVARGEALVGMTDTDDVVAAQRRGLRVAASMPRHGLPGEKNAGTLVIPNAAGLVGGGPNPTAATRLLAFLASETVERMLYESASRNIPLAHPTIEVDPTSRVDEPLAVGIPEVATAMDPAVDRAMKRLDPDRIRRLRTAGPGRSIGDADAYDSSPGASRPEAVP
jgi:iron(III) transport system substrate-binding protein